jgi:hypothetical protein
LFIDKVIGKHNADKIVAPLFVLNDLRQLHGHLVDESFQSRYDSCKERLGLVKETSDLVVFRNLITAIIKLFESLYESKNG